MYEEDDEQGGALSNQGMEVLSVVVMIPLAIAVFISMQDHRPMFHPRRADGPGGYLDTAYNQQLNLEQTGVWDVTIPLDVRQEHARRIGVEVPGGPTKERANWEDRK